MIPLRQPVRWAYVHGMSYRNMKPTHNGTKLNTAHRISHSENCETTWRTGIDFSKKHHWKSSSMINSQPWFIPTDTGHAVLPLAVSFTQFTESNNKLHNSLDICFHNELETPIIFPHRLTEFHNEVGYAVRVRRVKIRRYQHKTVAELLKQILFMKIEHAERLFWTGRHIQ